MELHYDIDCLTLCGAWGLEGLPDFMCPPFPPEYNVGLRGRRTRPWTLGAIKSERFFRKTESMFLSPNVGARRFHEGGARWPPGGGLLAAALRQRPPRRLPTGGGPPAAILRQEVPLNHIKNYGHQQK